MNVIGTFCILSVILARLDQCYAFLECKSGSIENVEGHPILERNVSNVSCSGEQNYCAAVTCTRIGFSFILWACAVHNNKTQCADVFTKDARNQSGLKDIDCDCEFGEFREELANVHFLPPELPTENHSLRPTVANLWLIFVLLTFGAFGLVESHAFGRAALERWWESVM